MTSISELLTRALLLDEPSAPRDVVPHTDARDEEELWGDFARPCRVVASSTAGRDLHTLCETIVSYTAVSSLKEFVTEKLPEPRGARVVGCVLQLTGVEDGARFWWQYAAGGGDTAAAYCLYLHHLSLGETDVAAWWREQAYIGAQPDDAEQLLLLLPPKEPDGKYDWSTRTVLHVLGKLLHQTDRPRNEAVDAVMDYIPGAVAVGYVEHPDFELPLPRWDFAEQIALLLAAATALEAVYDPKPGTSL